MEWMLQVMDEIDDAIGAVRQWALGFGAAAGLGAAAAMGMAGIAAAIWSGQEPLLVLAAAAMLSVAAALKMHGTQLQIGR